jgi:hypothetical protein
MDRLDPAETPEKDAHNRRKLAADVPMRTGDRIGPPAHARLDPVKHPEAPLPLTSTESFFTGVIGDPLR